MRHFIEEFGHTVIVAVVGAIFIGFLIYMISVFTSI